MIEVTCDCGKSYDVPDEWAGKAAKCKACGAGIEIPAAATVVPSVTACRETPPKSTPPSTLKKGLLYGMGGFFGVCIAMLILFVSCYVLVGITREHSRGMSAVEAEAGEQNKQWTIEELPALQPRYFGFCLGESAQSASRKATPRRNTYKNPGGLNLVCASYSCGPVLPVEQGDTNITLEFYQNKLVRINVVMAKGQLDTAWHGIIGSLQEKYNQTDVDILDRKYDFTTEVAGQTVNIYASRFVAKSSTVKV